MGAMAPPLFEVLLIEIYPNCDSKILPYSGTPDFENLTEALSVIYASILVFYSPETLYS